MYRIIVKPVLDRFMGLLLLIILYPLLVVVSSILIIYFKGNPFFFQDRPGKSGKIFKLIKFRTMRDIRDNNGYLLPDKDRITYFGSLMRSLSIDELPQLLNVLKGDMSIVGPRPLLKEYLSLYNSQQLRRHEVKPGMTGWAQVNGRNTINWEEKFEFDVWYVDNISFRLDMRILWLTLKKVIRREGISYQNATTMKPFTGNL